MSMRMVPLKGTFQKLARLVRDVTSKLGKDVEFVTEGEDTEIDRTLVDVVGDPLVHMVRNALDHGVETPEDRERAGKPRQGGGGEAPEDESAPRRPHRGAPVLAARASSYHHVVGKPELA